jgi:tetratricopeptide (TPR) repeat protein
MRVTLLPKKRVLVVFACLCVSEAFALPQSSPPGARYAQCLSATDTDPASALSAAAEWLRAGGGAAARHCQALALVGLKRYDQAGAALDALGRAPDVAGTQMRAAIFDQAGNAWLLAGNGAKAAASLSAALALSGGDADLFADLARAQAMRKKWAETESALNAALSLAPRRIDLLVLRASARRALKNFVGAHDDIEAALKLDPGNAGALVERGLLRKQAGDLAGARRDFQAAAKADPNSEAAVTARDNLDALSGP